MPRVVAPILATIACLGAAMLGLALLPAKGTETVDTPAGPVDRERAYTYAEKVGLIGRTVYERVVLPRRPGADAGYSHWAETLRRATPLMLAGLAVTLAFRAGVLNIGAQGQYVAGAIAGTAVALHLSRPAWVAIPVHLLAAMAAGALCAAIAAVLERWRRVPVVLSTILLNFVAIELLLYLLRGPMRSFDEAGVPRDPQSDELPWPARLPPVNPDGPEPAEIPTFPGWNAAAFSWLWQIATRLYPPIWIALIAAAALAFLLRRTTFGFRVRIVGDNPEAARFAGIGVGAVSTATLALSGALAGLAGAVGVAGVAPYVLYPDRATDGVGFTAIAAALLGRLTPLGTVCAAMFLSALSTAFKALERSDLQIHSSAAQALQGALILAILVATSPQLVKRLLRGRRPA
ncbi:MAG: ABC transporter permease [Phycisphaerae bacterium]